MKNRICALATLGVLTLAIAAGRATAPAQPYSVLYNFGTQTGDPTNPIYLGIVAQGRDGNLYSTTLGGGANGVGTVFNITPAGTVTVVHSFDSTNNGPYAPYGGLTLGSDGKFYGTTRLGGTGGIGTVFKITSSGGLTILHNFAGGSDGASPYAPPVEGRDGNFYGTAPGGGAGNGVVYKVTPKGTMTILYRFDGPHGSAPYAPLVQGSDGNFYGTTSLGGSNFVGVIFKITAAGQLTVLYNFDVVHGQYPTSPLVEGDDGNFYGTANGGNGFGVMFKVTPTGTLTVLHTLDGKKEGIDLSAGLVQATDGNLYGTSPFSSPSYGTIFKISPAGTFSVLYTFDKTTGAQPEVTLIQHTNGILYGDTYIGGTGSQCSGGCGVFYGLNEGLVPFVSLLPTSNKVGKIVEILGQGFIGTTGVFFNGTAANFTVVSDTYLTATVPAGATTGAVTVATPGGTLTSNKQFRVTPQILSFAPTSGPVGKPVTITGVSLLQTTNVTFGGVKATNFTVNSDTKVTATVPTGAKTGHVAITTPGGTAVSKGIFTVTQ